jgi:hypothetical protein
LLPWPGTLSRSISPPIKSAMRLVSARPRPVPPWLRVDQLSACWKGSNSRVWSAWAMPVSWTENRSIRRSSSPQF